MEVDSYVVFEEEAVWCVYNDWKRFRPSVACDIIENNLIKACWYKHRKFILLFT